MSSRLKGSMIIPDQSPSPRLKPEEVQWRDELVRRHSHPRDDSSKHRSATTNNNSCLLMLFLVYLFVYLLFTVSGTGSRPPILRWSIRQNLLHRTKLPPALPNIPEPRALLQPPQCTRRSPACTSEASQSEALHGPARLRVPRIPDIAFVSNDLWPLWPQVSLTNTHTRFWQCKQLLPDSELV